jgi:hypothetical protein
LFGQQLHTRALTLKMPRRLLPHQQFGKYGTPAPDPGAHITLPRQNPQQTEQLQLGRPRRISQRNTHGQRWRTTGVFQFRQTHRRPLLSDLRQTGGLTGDKSSVRNPWSNSQ